MEFEPGIKSYSKPEIESVINQKQEYKLIGSIIRRRGLKLYSYSPREDLLVEVCVEQSSTYYTKMEDGKLVEDKKKNYQKSLIDPRNIHFEALNKKSAMRRLVKFKNKQLKDLSNLRFITGKKIKI